MNIQEAFNNVRIVVLNARMTGPEHDQLKQDLGLIAQRCQRADELEKEMTPPEPDSEEQHPEIPSNPKGE